MRNWSEIATQAQCCPGSALHEKMTLIAEGKAFDTVTWQERHSGFAGPLKHCIQASASLTCEWYSTECALVSSQRLSPPASIMKPVLWDETWRLRCQGREKSGLLWTQYTFTTPGMDSVCTHAEQSLSSCIARLKAVSCAGFQAFAEGRNSDCPLSSNSHTNLSPSFPQML